MHYFSTTQTVVLHMRFVGIAAGILLVSGLLAIELVPLGRRQRYILMACMAIVFVVFGIAVGQVQRSIR